MKRPNSHNSSIPPSKESIAPKTEKAKTLQATRSLREKANKKNGGQMGHKDSTLKMVSKPDDIIEHAPCFCTRCGNDLLQVSGTVVEIRQVFDILMPIRPIATEHQLLGKQCSCGHCCQTEFPGEVRSTVSYSVNIRAIVIYLSCIQSNPYKSLTVTLRDCFGVSLSQGNIDNILIEASRKSMKAYQSISERIEQSKFVGADETAANINVADHQICLAHLLKVITYLTKLDTHQKRSFQFAERRREAIHKCKTGPWVNIDRRSIVDKFNHLLIICSDGLHQKITALIKSLTKYKDYVFKFLFDPDVPYDNNASERAVRNIKAKQKVSGMFKSDVGAASYSQIHSITQTARKNNQNPFTAIMAVLKFLKIRARVLSSYKQ